jgi:hypothetical protein
MAARYLLILLSCALVAHVSVDPAFANDADAPAAIPFSPPGQTMEVEPPAQPMSGNPWSAPDHGNKKSRWYGHQVLLVDAIGIGLFGVALAKGHDNFALLGTATMLLGGPVVHIANSEGGNMLLSVPLRILLPIGGAAFGGHVFEFCDLECHGPNFEGVLIGVGLGVAAASIIDAALIARTRRKRGGAGAPALSPQIGFTGNRFTASIGGWF